MNTIKAMQIYSTAHCVGGGRVRKKVVQSFYPLFPIAQAIYKQTIFILTNILEKKNTVSIISYIFYRWNTKISASLNVKEDPSSGK